MKEIRTERKGFFLYLDMYAPISDMSDAQLGQLLRAMFAWHGQCWEMDFKDPVVEMAFRFWRIDEDNRATPPMHPIHRGE